MAARMLSSSGRSLAAAIAALHKGPSRSRWSPRTGAAAARRSGAPDGGLQHLRVSLPSHFPGVVHVELHRPERMNALSSAMGRELLALCAVLADDAHAATARAVVLSGSTNDTVTPVTAHASANASARAKVDAPATTQEGEADVRHSDHGSRGRSHAFSVGRDLKETLAMAAVPGADGAETRASYMRLALDTVMAVKSLPMPTVAAINGHAFGWGLELALACDIRLAMSTRSTDTREPTSSAAGDLDSASSPQSASRRRTAASPVLCFPECGLGIFPGAGGAVLLPQLVGAAAAAEMVFTARRISGEEAAAVGLVNRAVPDPLCEALQLAATIAQNAPLGVRAAKRVMRAAVDGGGEASAGAAQTLFDRAIEFSLAERQPLSDTQDHIEALRAFSERRNAEFLGH